MRIHAAPFSSGNALIGTFHGWEFQSKRGFNKGLQEYEEPP